MTWWMWLVVVIGLFIVASVAVRTGGDIPVVGFTALVVAVVVALAILIPMAVDEKNRWEQWCRDQGGHVVEDTDVFNTVNVNTNGQPGVGIGFNTDYYCLSSDGRILGMYG